MRTTLLALGAGSLALAGCTVEPVEIPESMAEAAKVCFVVQLVNAANENDISKDDPVTLTDYSKAVEYAMIAAAQQDGFTPNTIMEVLPTDALDLVEIIRDQDYEGALTSCQKKFEVSPSGSTPTLPEKDIDAGTSCYATSQFLLAGFEGDEVDSEGKVEEYMDLNNRLESQLDELIVADAEAFAAFSNKEDAEEMIAAGLKQAFSQGNPLTYLDACDARFPEKQ